MDRERCRLKPRKGEGGASPPARERTRRLRIAKEFFPFTPHVDRFERASGVAVQRPPLLLNRDIITAESYLARCVASLSTAYACATALKSPSAASRSSALGALSG